ncbi:histidine kinase [Streptomyces sp. TRM49041]|uniref:sensor histidine kinase n=1 Tax=Streptomyces sp. TRM49041 TaxID=2603216 RepID=UPI0011F06D28|nr:histidine kinase [Streptomyces sp. TRM49041]
MTSAIRDRWAPYALLAGAVAAAGLSVWSPWWAIPCAGCAFLAGRRPGWGRATVVALAVLLAGGVVAVVVVPGWITLGSRFVAVVAGAEVLPWFAGRFWRQYRELVRAGWERAELLERERQLVAEQARLRERTRIAQDMHDVLGHDLSLIALSAGALKLAPDLPETHRETAGDIRARAEAAVDRLGEVIGVLREGGEAAPTRPHGDMRTLIDQARRAGLSVEAELDDGEVPAAVAGTVHRIVQEALTNVAKHAPGAAATVRVRSGAAATQAAVENGPGSGELGPCARGGHGLIGLDERVRLAGGRLEYGPEGEGFAVRVWLPHTAVVQPTAAQPPLEHRRARRRLGRTTVAAILVPPTVVVLLASALQVWEVLMVRESVLTPQEYADLRPGQERTELRLPERQTPYRPSDARCEFYAVTANPLDDQFADTAYRLCFRDATLTSADMVDVA